MPTRKNNAAVFKTTNPKVTMILLIIGIIILIAGSLMFVLPMFIDWLSVLNFFGILISVPNLGIILIIIGILAIIVSFLR